MTMTMSASWPEPLQDVDRSDEELREAREKAQLLRQLQAQIQALDVLGGG